MRPPCGFPARPLRPPAACPRGGRFVARDLMATLTFDTHDRTDHHGAADMAGGQAERNDRLALREDIVRLEGRVCEMLEAFNTDLIKRLVPILLGQAGLIVVLVRLFLTPQ